MYHIFFIHSSVSGHLDFLSWLLCIEMHVSFFFNFFFIFLNSSFLFIFRYMPESGIADIATPVLVFSRNSHTVFHSGCTKCEKWKWSRSAVSNSLQLVDYSLPGSSFHGIFQARILEWVAISFSNQECTPFLSFIICRLFDDGHSDWCEVINRYHFLIPSKRNGSLFSFCLLARWLWSDWPGTENSDGHVLGHF